MLVKQYSGSIKMRLVDAVYKRITDLANERNISLYKIAKDSCVPYSTIATMTRSKTVKLSTVYSICLGVNISLEEFFHSELFADNKISE